MEHQIFYQLSLVMVVAAIIALLARAFRQPMIIAYIVAGFVVGPSVFNIIQDHTAFESFSQIGIALLLFIIGLELNLSAIKSMGKPSLVTFAAIIAGVGSLGWLAAHLLGFNTAESIVLATGLLFSSTIIVIKSLSDKREQTRLYGRLAIGILLTDDLAATVSLVIVSAIAGNDGTFADLLWLVLKGVGLGVALSFVGGYVMPKLTKVFATSQELLYVFAIAWAFGVASAFYWSGFSLEVGALFAGVALAHLPYVQAIGSRLKPLRDFFLVLFFISLGRMLHIENIAEAIVPALVFSALALTVKPLVTQASLGWLGYTKQTSFKASLHLSQISEFSVIFFVLAYSTGLVSEKVVTVGTLTALFTIAVSAYLMKYDDRLYKRFAKKLSIFERSETKREIKALGHYPLVLIGYQEGASTFVKAFREMKKRYVVIDYSPEIIESLQHQHINCLYGDVTDPELLDEMSIHKSELVISTLADPATNRMLASHITRHNPEAIFICHATKLDTAESLYQAGAAYVLMPHFIGDMHIEQFIQKNGSDKKAFAKYRSEHLINLGQMAVRK